MKKILYVDDEPINLLIFKIAFGQMYNIITAESALEGMEILANESDIEIVFSDLRMPVMDGLEFVELAKAKYQDIRYYLLTGYELTDEIQKALDVKLLNKYFAKPFNKEEIVLEIDGQ